jgi:hypothetical protein
MSVHVADLRGLSHDAAEHRIEQVLPDRSTFGRVRLVVLDDAVALVDRFALFARLQATRQVSGLICVAVGPAVSRQAGVALRASGVLDNDDSATIWVGDAHGVVWGTERTGAPGRAGVESDPADAGLDQLVTCLSMTDGVFDEVLAKVGQVPGRTASPGLRVTTGRLAGTDLRQARASATRLLIGRPPERMIEHLPGVDESELAPLLGDGGSAGVPAPIIQGGPLDQLRQEADDAVRTAARRLRGLRGLKGLLFGSGRGSAAWPWLDYTIQRVERYHHAVVGAFERGDTGGRMDVRQRAELEQLGLRIGTPRGLERGTVLGRLHTMVDTALRGYPLNTVVDWLRVLSDRAAPTGSGDSRSRLDHLRSRMLGAAVATPPPFPLTIADPKVLTAVALCCLLAAAGSGWGLVSGVTSAVAWTLAAWFASARVPTRAGIRGAATALRPALLLHPAAAGAGVAGGRFVAGLLDLPPVAGFAALAVAAAGLGVTLHLWWDAAAAAWTSRLSTAGTSEGIAGYERLLTEVAVREWVLADIRTYLADAARVVAGGLADTIEVLEEQAVQATPGAGLGARTGDGSPAAPARTTSGMTSGMTMDSADALETLLTEDLGDAVRAVLLICWERLRAGGLGQAGDGLADEMRAVLTAYEQHLARHNVFEPPPFAAADRGGERKLDVMLGPPGQLVDLLGAEPGDAFVQLCAADDLGMLDASPQTARMVRFAPQFVREPVIAAANGSAGRLGDVHWTTSGHAAGVLRLMPMRSGVVVREWPSNELEELA